MTCMYFALIMLVVYVGSTCLKCTNVYLLRRVLNIWALIVYVLRAHVDNVYLHLVHILIANIPSIYNVIRIVHMLFLYIISARCILVYTKLSTKSYYICVHRMHTICIYNICIHTTHIPILPHILNVYVLIINAIYAYYIHIS